MRDEAMERLLDYDRRRYWLENGWSIRIRVRETQVSEARPHGIRYAFRKTDELVPYEFSDADTLLCDFFNAVEGACKAEGVAFDFVDADLELEDGDEAQEPE